jgi:hypothetical protein
MNYPRILLTVFLTVLSVSSTLCFSKEELAESLKRAEFRAAYNVQRADRRLAALSKLNGCKEQQSIETLYFVSLRDPDPEIRSRAFSAMVHCGDTYGYTAHLAADSFNRELDLGVKVEKAVAMESLRYKWAALNAMVGFLRTLRWNNWNWNLYERSGGYIASGNPPEIPGEPNEVKDDGEGYDGWRNREPLRWRSENDLMGIVAATINRMSGTQLESRPRIDQEIVKWWERKSDLWQDYDRKLRARTLASSKEIHFKDPVLLQDDSIQPGKDTLKDLLGKEAEPAKNGKPIMAEKSRGPRPEDE